MHGIERRSALLSQEKGIRCRLRRRGAVATSLPTGLLPVQKRGMTALAKRCPRLGGSGRFKQSGSVGSEMTSPFRNVFAFSIALRH